MNFGDRLVSIEALDFALPGGGTETLDLAVFLAVLEAETGELRDATLAYVALLDRLPDALGLYYWAGQLAGGADLGAIAAEFVQTGEAQAIWGPALGDPGALIDLAYERILGREADAGGARFWTEALETGGLAPGAFLWQFTLGAVRGDGADARTLSDKIDLGLAFAAIEGLTDVEAAGDALDLYDPADRAPSRDAALAFIDALASTAAAPAPGDDAQLLAPLSGLVDDPFAMA